MSNEFKKGAKEGIGFNVIGLVFAVVLVPFITPIVTPIFNKWGRKVAKWAGISEEEEENQEEQPKED